MLIKRDAYLNQLISKMNNGTVKIVTGIRRCGKSFLLFKLFYEFLKAQGVLEEEIIQIPLDDEDYAIYRDAQKLYEYVKTRIKDNNRKYYVLIDEAQFAISKEEIKNQDEPLKLYSVLNGLLRKGNVDIYITGSNSKFLSTDVMTEFRGRGSEIYVAPLAFSEFMTAFQGDKYDGWKEYSMYGGLPHILSEKNEADKVRYLTNLNSEIYLRDIVERYGIRDSDAMEAVMKIIASAIGSLSNAQKISDTFKSNKGELSLPTISNYLTSLQEAFIIKKSERYDIKGRKFISTPSKYYYTDLGLRNALLNFRQYEPTHIMENIIYNELIYRGFNVDVGVIENTKKENNKRVYQQLEVDFVANLGSKRYYIQSAYEIPNEEKLKQEQKSLTKISDSFKKIIITHSNIPSYQNEYGITVMNPFDFLLNKDSLDW